MTTFDEAPIDYDGLPEPPADDARVGGQGRGGRDGGGSGRGGGRGGSGGGGGRNGGGDRGGRGPSVGSENYERMPPQDIAAEQGVLGGMMLSKDAIADVVEVLKGIDFYRPAHELVYDAILDLYSRGEPADPVTVSAELTNRNELARVGGTPYLHDLISTVPTAANAGFYARIVRERAVLRRLVEAGTRIVQMGYGGDGMDVDAIVNSAQAEVYAVTETQTKEDYVVLGDVIEGAIDEIEASSHRGEGMVGVPTGFQDLDQLTNGLHPGQMIVIAARPAVGKALALDTPLATPGGWTTMGQVAVGDELLGGDGRPTRVVAATGVLTGRPCFEVHFSDGSVVVADAGHQWATVEPGRDVLVRTSAELADDLRAGELRSVAVTAPLELPAADLPAPPYLIGAALAGWAGEPVADPELHTLLEDDGALAPSLEAIPLADVVRSSVQDRRAVLAGFLDVSGAVLGDGAVEVVLPARYADVVLDLLHGLGHQTHRAGCVVAFSTDDDVFRVERKQRSHKEARAASSAGRFLRTDVRHVVEVRPVPSVPVRCVQVDAQDHLFLAGREMVPTHNSTLGLDIARSAAIRNGLATVIFSLEMGRNEISMRLLSAEARIPLQNMRKGTMREDDWTKLARTMGAVSEAPMYIDDSPNMSLMEIRSKCRRLKQKADLKLVVIDYLQLMTSGKRVESRQQEVSEFSRQIKLLAKEIEVPVIALSQLNRGSEQRTDKKPQMSDLRESGCLTADTRVLRADTGAETTLEELFALQAKDVPVWSLDPSLRYVRRHLTHVFPTGTREVFRLRTSSGRELRATANHPFLTYDGWKPLGELSPGDKLAVPRHVPAPAAETVWDEDRVLLLAHLLGGGDLLRHRPVRYVPVDGSTGSVVRGAAATMGVSTVVEEHGVRFAGATGELNPLTAWLDDLGVLGTTPLRRTVPVEVSGLPKRQIATFLRHLWGTRGGVDVEAGVVHLATAGRRLAEDVSRLLLRFGIASEVRNRTRTGGFPHGATLEITGTDDLRRFLQEIGIDGPRAAGSDELLDVVRRPAPRAAGEPRLLADDLRDLLATRPPADGDGALLERTPLAQLTDVFDRADLDVLAVNDVLWDEVVAVEADGEEQVFDATVLGGHNFIANGVAVHNSIEQDADMVILLHREDMYEKESPRAGEADFIVAKHRNGPTDTITVAFQGHYSRFVDMAS